MSKPKSRPFRQHQPLDKDLLKEVLAVQSYTGEDQAMCDYVIDWVYASGLAQRTPVEMQYDGASNLYITKGTPPAGKYYPSVVAHTDTVHPLRKDLTVMEWGGRLYGMDTAVMEQAGIGGDDKVGIYVALEMLRRLPFVKVALFRDEEIGCAGSGKAELDFFDDCAFVLQADRWGYKDFIERSNGCELHSDEFYRAVSPLLGRHGYGKGTGTCTDVGELKDRGLAISVANVSCGYYSYHLKSEYVVMEDVERCLNLFYQICTKHTHRQWVHTYQRPAYRTYTVIKGGKYYQRWTDWDGVADGDYEEEEADAGMDVGVVSGLKAGATQAGAYYSTFYGYAGYGTYEWNRVEKCWEFVCSAGGSRNVESDGTTAKSEAEQETTTTYTDGTGTVQGTVYTPPAKDKANGNDRDRGNGHRTAGQRSFAGDAVSRAVGRQQNRLRAKDNPHSGRGSYCGVNPIWTVGWPAGNPEYGEACVECASVSIRMGRAGYYCADCQCYYSDGGGEVKEMMGRGMVERMLARRREAATPLALPAPIAHDPTHTDAGTDTTIEKGETDDEKATSPA